MSESEDLFARRLTWDDARAFAGASVGFLAVDEPGAPAVPLRVVAVTERPPVAGSHQFSITFRGPREPLLPQRTYRARHPALGDFAIFITAIGQSADATDYEACFAHAT